MPVTNSDFYALLQSVAAESSMNIYGLGQIQLLNLGAMTLIQAVSACNHAV